VRAAVDALELGREELRVDGGRVEVAVAEHRLDVAR
jgi:hypothetical protein